MRVILNADDFGRSKARNDAIVETMRAGLSTQCSIILNMPDTIDAANMAKEYGFANKVACHINLTIGKPLTEAICGLPDFCGSDGSFNNAFHHSPIKRFLIRATEPVRAEMRAQIERYLALGFSLMHMDSHHWVQLDRRILAIMEPLMMEYGFRSFRRSENIQYLTSVQIIRQRQWYRHFPFYLRYYDRCLMPSRQEFRTVDYVGRIQNIAHAPKGFSIDDPNGSVEFLFHPIYQDGVLWDKGVASLAEMVTPIIQGGFELISYNDL